MFCEADSLRDQLADLTAENERLKGCLKKTNSNMEQGERELYLQINGLEDSIDKLTAERDTAVADVKRLRKILDDC